VTKKIMARRKKVKYIFITGGVVSSLGKGITASSLGLLLKQRGYKVTIQKFDLSCWVKRVGMVFTSNQ